MDENKQHLIEKASYHNFTKQQIVGSAKSLAEKLNKEIEKGDDELAFMIALSIAGFKDFLDVILVFMGVGLIPGVSFCIGLFLTSFLFFFMYGKGFLLKWKLRFWFWTLGLFVDGLPVFNALPLNVLLVLYAWYITKKRAKNSELKLKNLDKITVHQMRKLDQDIGLLESSKE